MKKFLPILLFFGLSIIVLLFLSNWKQPAKDVLDRSLWQVVEMENTPLLPDSTLTMRFHNQKVNGSSGCNTFKGTYTVKGDAISITLLERTSDNCMNPGIMQQERSFIALLPQASKFVLTGADLSLWIDESREIKLTSLTGNS
ncbi:MAG TPA: META domain-containing protein [Anaerolineaceae bacterium]|nr:META domain-containing protein [Anaerolineaceae bacterium]